MNFRITDFASKVSIDGTEQIPIAFGGANYKISTQQIVERSGIQQYSTYASLTAAVAAGAFTLPRTVLVVADETNGGLRTFYAWNGVAITGTAGAVSATEFNYLSSQTLKKWRAALGRARAGGNVARIAIVSDSTGRGAGSNGSPSTNAVVKSWPTQLAALLSASGTPAQADSFFGDGTFGVPLSTLDPRIGFTGGWAASGAITSLGGKMLQASAAGTLSFTPAKARKSYDVYYPTNTGLGTFNIDIGGTGTIAVNTNTTIGFAKTTITAGAASTSPLNISYSSGGACLIAGVEGKDPSDVISIINMGRSGSKASDWVASTGSPWDSLSALAFLAPDLTAICLNINDWLAGTNIVTFKSQIQAVITSVLSSGDVILVTGVPSNTASASAAVQATFVAATYELARANGLPLLDMSMRFGSYVSANSLGFMFDSLHPTGAGYSDNSSAMRSMLLTQ